MTYTKHYSVLKNECINYLTEGTTEGEVAYFADLTFGGGGHSFEFLYRNPLYKVRSTDQDPDALKNGEARILAEDMQNRIKLFNTNFVHFPEMASLECADVFETGGGFQGILLDLGVSSHHFDEAGRGFSFRFDGPLDMRMSANGISAAEVVNTFEVEEDRKSVV